MTKPNINEAAEVVMNAEKTALSNLVTAIDTFEASLIEIDSTLPQSFSMDARRMITDIRSTLSYKRTSELPSLIARYEPATQQPLPAPVVYDPNA
jgi:hypothetical protein